MTSTLTSGIFWSLFGLALRVSPRRALAAIGWLVRGKRIRGWNQLRRTAAEHSQFYGYWIKYAEPLIIDDWLRYQQTAITPSIVALIVGTDSTPTEHFRESAISLRQVFSESIPIYSHPITVEGTLPLPAAVQCSMRQALQLVEAGGHDWILPLLAGDRVSASLGAVLKVQRATGAAPSIIYWDEDRLEDGHRSNPWIKPDWDELLFLGRDCLTGSAAFKTAAARAAASGLEGSAIEQDVLHRFALRAASLTDSRPLHVPLILTHREGSADLWSPAQRCEHVAQDWPGHSICKFEGRVDGFGTVVPSAPVRWPSVSILIPTKDRGELLESCINSLDLLEYEGEIQLIITDNGTTEPYARALLDRLAGNRSATVLNAPGPFNFSALNNLAASRASGELLCLLNNDVEAINGFWLEAMIRHAVLDGTGAVGAQLLYPDGRVQHAGVAIGLGDAAGHIEKGRCPSDHSFVGWHSVTREVSAVTAACLLVRRDLYTSVGGLDEQRFPVAFNDVDFCLRLKARGLRNLLVAEATLVHHESLSRGDDWAPANATRFKLELANLHARWNTKGFIDPHFNALFSRSSEQCVLSI